VNIDYYEEAPPRERVLIDYVASPGDAGFSYAATVREVWKYPGVETSAGVRIVIVGSGDFLTTPPSNGSFPGQALILFAGIASSQAPGIDVSGLPQLDFTTIADTDALCLAINGELQSRLPGWGRMLEALESRKRASDTSSPATTMAPTTSCIWYEIDVDGYERLRLSYSFTNESSFGPETYVENWLSCCAGVGSSARIGEFDGYPAVWTTSGGDERSTPDALFVGGAILDVQIHGPVDGSVPETVVDEFRPALLRAFLEVW